MTLNSQIPRLGRHFIRVVHFAQVCSLILPPGPWEQGARSDTGERGSGGGEERDPWCCSLMAEPSAQKQDI